MAGHRLTLWCAASLVSGAAVLVLSATEAVQPEPNRAPGSSAGVISLGTMTPVHFDLSPPLTQIAEPPSAPPPDRAEDRDARGPLAGPQDPDEALQHPFEAGSEIPSPTIGFNAFDNTSALSGPVPPDPVGDVGPSHYVAMATSRYAVYSKAGGLLFGPVSINTVWAGFNGPCETASAGNPMVLYDQLADRWLIMQATAVGPPYFLCVAISQTANPTGAFHRYSISTGSRLPDHPKVGMWPNAYVFTTREFSGATFDIGVYGMHRAQALGGNPATQVVGFLVTPGAMPYRVGDGLLPADLDGFRLPPTTNPAFLVGVQDNGGGYGAPFDAINIWQLSLNFSGGSTLTWTSSVATAAFDSVLDLCGGTPNCIPQPGTAQRLDHQGYQQRLLHRAAYRNHGTHQAIVSNTSVEAAANVSGVRWFEVRSPQAAPTLYQQGTYAPGTVDGIHRWAGSVAQDQKGNMALGYSASSASVSPSVRYTGRLSTDTLGTMPQGEGIFQAGGGSQTGSSQWGDYTAMTVDPVDDCTFWYISQYYPVSSARGWRLRVGAFEFPSCAPPATILALSPLGTVRTGQTVQLWALVRNDGTTPMTAESRVWFNTNVTNSWVGSAPLTGLAPGASQWYAINFVIPNNATTGTRSYWAQVWKDGPHPQSSFTGPLNFSVTRIIARIDALWAVSGAYPGGTTTFWALVRNLDTVPLTADDRVVFWNSAVNFDFAFTSIAGLAPGQTAWYSVQWPVPMLFVNPGNYTYWAQARRGALPISDWLGPHDFPIGFNYPFTSNISGWGQVGFWSHVSSAYMYTAGQPNFATSAYRAANLRYLDYEVRVWRNGCDICANRIMLRGTPGPFTGAGEWNSALLFQYTREGDFSVFKTVGGMTSTLQTWTPTPAIARGSAWNTLRVVSTGDAFHFYINGVLVWSGVDTSLMAAGSVGIGAYNDASAGNGFWADYARGIPTGTTIEGADRAADAPPAEHVSDAQQRLNDAANRRPAGNMNRSR